VGIHKRTQECGQTFQRLIDQVGADLDFFFIYLNKILVASKDERAHKEHLHLVMQRLRKFSLILNLEQCKLGHTSVEFLGHKISARGVQPIVKHVDVIQQFSGRWTRRHWSNF
jgi:cleavage and polyadenylation specificity factor subunit 1